MKTSHTPGQWEAHGQAVYSGEIYIAQCWDETSRELTAYVNAVGSDQLPENGSEAQANARLIAAAPELLASLMAIYEMVPFDVPESDPRVTMARELILKLTQP